MLLVDEDLLTDGKWCYIVFWVIGRPNTRWNLLKKRLLEVCPSYLSTTDIQYYCHENKQPLKHDVFLLKFWCSYDRKGLLHGNLDSSQSPRVSPFTSIQNCIVFYCTSVSDAADVSEVLCELELTIKRVKVSTTPDGSVLDLFFVTDSRFVIPSRNFTHFPFYFDCVTFHCLSS